MASVTNKHLNDKLDKVLDLTSRMDERQKNMEKVLDATNAGILIQNGRISKLENWKSKITGIAAAGVPIVSMAASWLQHKLEGR